MVLIWQLKKHVDCIKSPWELHIKSRNFIFQVKQLWWVTGEEIELAVKIGKMFSYLPTYSMDENRRLEEEFALQAPKKQRMSWNEKLIFNEWKLESTIC